jgi:L-alanine-DL-glutamate epimerase-like enolase superfamily enzyme
VFIGLISDCEILRETSLIHELLIGDIFNGWSIFENAPSLGKDGYITMPQGPGLGVTLRRDLIERT